MNVVGSRAPRSGWRHLSQAGRKSVASTRHSRRRASHTMFTVRMASLSATSPRPGPGDPQSETCRRGRAVLELNERPRAAAPTERVERTVLGRGTTSRPLGGALSSEQLHHAEASAARSTDRLAHRQQHAVSSSRSMTRFTARFCEHPEVKAAAAHHRGATDGNHVSSDGRSSHSVAGHDDRMTTI